MKKSILFLTLCILLTVLGEWSSPILPIHPKKAHSQNIAMLKDALKFRNQEKPEEDKMVVLSSQSAEYIKPYEDSIYHLTLLPYRGQTIRVSGMIYPSIVAKDTLVWLGNTQLGYQTISFSSLDRSGPMRNEPSYFEIMMNVPKNADILEYGFTNVGYGCTLLPKFTINVTEEVL